MTKQTDVPAQGSDASDLMDLLKAAGYDLSLPHPACYAGFSYLKFAELLRATQPRDALENLVARFSKALLAKLKLARANGRSGWERDDWEAHCQQGLLKHVEKGDPRDVAAYCAFMWHHGWITASPAPATTSDPFNRKQVEAVCRAVCKVEGVDPDDDTFGDGCDPAWTRYADAVAEVLPAPATTGDGADAVANLMRVVHERWNFEECQFDAIEQALSDPECAAAFRSPAENIDQVVMTRAEFNALCDQIATETTNAIRQKFDVRPK